MSFLNAPEKNFILLLLLFKIRFLAIMQIYIMQMQEGTQTLLAVAMVIEIRSFSFLVKKIVINSRIGRFRHSFQKTFPHKKRKMLNAYFKFVQQSDFYYFGDRGPAGASGPK